LLTTDFESFRRLAAPVMLPASTTCRKAMISSRRHDILREYRKLIRV